MILCGLYAGVVIVAVVASLTVSDPKGWFVLLQLPLVPVLAVLALLGLERVIGGSWWGAYAVCVPATLLVLYGLGWASDWLRHRAS